MRGFVLSMVVYVLVAIVSVSVLLMLVNTYAPEVTRSGLCWAIRGVSSIIPGQGWSKASVPEFCSKDDSYAEEVVEGGKEAAVQTIAVHSLACWKKTGSGLFNKTETCSALYLQAGGAAPSYTVTEAEVAQELVDNGLCSDPQDLFDNKDDFANADLAVPCGDRNDLVWDANGAISSNSVVVIKYLPGSASGLGSVHVK